MNPIFGSYDRGATFRASDAPLLVVDTDLVIRDVNPAYLLATDRAEEELLGTPMFEAFPDNPDDPLADGVANLGASLERVFRGDSRDRMPLQRYDIPANGASAGFARRFWSPVNSPLHDDVGRLVGALHHVEDITAIADPLWQAGTSWSAALPANTAPCSAKSPAPSSNAGCRCNPPGPSPGPALATGSPAAPCPQSMTGCTSRCYNPRKYTR